MINSTIDYYNTNAEKFVNDTINVEFTDIQNKFISKLHSGAMILDFGCGSGRDTKYFISRGYQVDAIDGSKELCKIATEYTGIEVKNIYFEDFKEQNKYDAIWACSSILHLARNDLKNVIKNMVIALKDNGVIYTSFKYGTFEGERNGRYFTDMTEKSFNELIHDINGVIIEEYWVTGDARPERGNEKWLNLILRKK